MREAVPLAFLYSIEYSDLAPHPPHPNPRARAVGRGPVARDRVIYSRSLFCTHAHAQFSHTTTDHTRPDTGAPEAELSRLCGLRPYCV